MPPISLRTALLFVWHSPTSVIPVLVTGISPNFVRGPAYLRYRFIRSFLRSPPHSASACPRCSTALGWRLSREASEGVESGTVLGARRGERGHDGSGRAGTMMPQPGAPHLRHRRRACILRLTAEW